MLSIWSTSYQSTLLQYHLSEALSPYSAQRRQGLQQLPHIDRSAHPSKNI